MNNKVIVIGILVVLAAVAIYFVPLKVQAPKPVITDFEQCVANGGTVMGNTCTAPSGTCCFQNPNATSEVVVSTPQPNTVVTSPLTVSGQALNSWYFEANLPMLLKDANGQVIAQKGFQAQSDWMTPGMVPFSGTLTFTMPTTQTGTLEIHNDNPSGDPNNDKVFIVPVKFW